MEGGNVVSKANEITHSPLGETRHEKAALKCDYPLSLCSNSQQNKTDQNQ